MNRANVIRIDFFIIVISIVPTSNVSRKFSKLNCHMINYPGVERIARCIGCNKIHRVRSSAIYLFFCKFRATFTRGRRKRMILNVLIFTPMDAQVLSTPMLNGLDGYDSFRTQYTRKLNRQSYLPVNRALSITKDNEKLPKTIGQRHYSNLQTLRNEPSS